MKVSGFTPERVDRFVRSGRGAKGALEAWRKVVDNARWTKYADIRATFRHADHVGSCIVFNLGGNKFRLIAKIKYETDDSEGRIYVVSILTHAEYDTEKWKKDCGCG